MERNYDLLVRVLDCFVPDYKEFDTVVFHSTNDFSSHDVIYNVIACKSVYLTVDNEGDVIIWDAKCSEARVVTVIWLNDIKSVNKKMLEITRRLAKLDII